MGKRPKAKRLEANRSVRESVELPPTELRSWRTEFFWLLPALVLGFLIYLNALHGAFVYDDQLQISRNTFIQDGIPDLASADF